MPLILTPQQPPYYETATTGEGEFKIYRALISQESTDSPTVIIIGTNTIGTIVWTRQGTGQYWGTLTAAFGDEKTLILTGNGATNALLTCSCTNDKIVINTQTITDNSLSDNLLYLTTLEIKVLNT